MKTRALALLSLGAFASTPVFAAYTAGHADIGIAFEDNQFDLHFHADEATIGGVEINDVEYEADGVTIQVVSSQTLSSDNAALGLLSGNSFYFLHEENPGDSLPFLGIATEEIAEGVFDSDITLSLGTVTAPGNFALWETGSTGSKIYRYSSTDASLTTDSNSLSLGAAEHYHYSYGFSTAGTYLIELIASGSISGTNYSNSATYTFNVVPEPSTYALIAGAAALGICLLRRRK